MNQQTGKTTTKEANKLLFELTSFKKKDREIWDRQVIKANNRKQAIHKFKNEIDVSDEFKIDSVRCLAKAKPKVKGITSEDVMKELKIVRLDK